MCKMSRVYFTKNERFLRNFYRPVNDAAPNAFIPQIEDGKLARRNRPLMLFKLYITPLVIPSHLTFLLSLPVPEFRRAGKRFWRRLGNKVRRLSV